jgi:hypothetical protein
MDRTATKVQTRSNPPQAGTEQLERIHSGQKYLASNSGWRDQPHHLNRIFQIPVTVKAL